jgi:Ohr subfamily peroxiredoxin
MRVLYTTEATAHGGRDGHVRSSDGILDLDLRVPVEMGGRGERATNPEQLFAAGYAACSRARCVRWRGRASCR